MTSKKTINKFLKAGPSVVPTPEDASGFGSYARVYDSDAFMPGTVMKKSTPDTLDSRYQKRMKKGIFVDSWLIWALYCMGSKKHRSFMPKIYALHIDWETSTFHAIMEKLDKIQPGKAPYQCSELKGTMRWIQNPETRIGVNKENFTTALQDLETMLPETFYFDGHSENWMYRGSSLVCNDPLHMTMWVMGDDEKLKAFNTKIYELGKITPNVIMIGKPNLATFDPVVEEVYPEIKMHKVIEKELISKVLKNPSIHIVGVQQNFLGVKWYSEVNAGELK